MSTRKKSFLFPRFRLLKTFDFFLISDRQKSDVFNILNLGNKGEFFRIDIHPICTEMVRWKRILEHILIISIISINFNAYFWHRCVICQRSNHFCIRNYQLHKLCWCLELGKIHQYTNLKTQFDLIDNPIDNPIPLNTLARMLTALFFLSKMVSSIFGDKFLIVL